ADAIDALREAHERAAAERVEIACRGGIGRTGTALAVLATLSGVPPTQAVDWVRKHYHPRAVETRRQRAWVASGSRRRYATGLVNWMRFPQVSSNTAVITGPISAGSWVNRTPC